MADITTSRIVYNNEGPPILANGFIRIDSSGATDNYYLELYEAGAQRFRIYENSNNVYFDGGPGNTHFRPRQGGGSNNFIITGANLGIGATSPSAPLTVAGSGADGTAMLRLEATGGTQTFNWISSVVYPNMAADKTIIKLFGRGQALNNQAYVGFKYAGDNSTSNQLTLGFYGNNFLVNLLANGNLGVGTQSPRNTTNHTSLTVNGTAVGRVDLAASGTIYASFYAVSSQVGLQTEADIPLIFGTGTSSTTALTLDASQNATFASTVTANDSIISQANDAGFIARNAAGTVIGTMGAESSSTPNVGKLTVRNNGNTRVNFNSNGDSYITGGNLGIGTTHPDKTLDIKSATTTSGVHFLQTIGGSNHVAGYAVGLGLDPEGYGNRNKIGIVAEGINQGWSRGKLHFLLRAENNVSAEATLSHSRMVITDDGDVGIGTTSPTARLHVNSGTTNTSAIFESTDTEVQVNFKDSTGTSSIRARNDFRFNSGNTELVRFESGGNVGIGNTSPSQKLHVTGSVLASSDVVAFSDIKLKENIKTLDGSKVYDMRGVSFTRKDTGKDSSGVIAQEIQKIAPELVTDNDGTLSVAYGNLTGYLIEAVKELKIEIEELKKCNCNCKK